MFLIKRFFALAALISLPFLTGCVSTDLQANIAPGEDISDIKSIYVQKFENDERGIEKLISDELNSLGYKASYGKVDEAPKDVDAVMSYQDKWMWDLTMYMLELKVFLEDPETNFVKADAFSYRTSLARKSPEEMVKEVLGKLFSEAEKNN